MHAGAPVVAFDIPPVREVTAGGRFARLVPVGDVVALAEAVLDAIAIAGHDTHVTEARQWVAENYSLDGVASRVEGLLLQVADASRHDQDES
jgi:glycosyltransferase involved in cell wall biosynthesis